MDEIKIPSISKEAKFEHWCVVELMGHQRISGLVTEVNLFGSALMRVDVPEYQTPRGSMMAAFTKFYGANAIYAITPVEEPVARAMAKQYDTRPIEEWRISGLLPQPEADEEEQGSLYGDYSSDDDGDDEDYSDVHIPPEIEDDEEVEQANFDYDPDCAACLSGRSHTITEHEDHLKRSAESGTEPEAEDV